METQRNAIKSALEALAVAGGKLTAESDIVFTGTKITLPATSTLRESIEFLENQERAEETEMAFNRSFQYRPWDGAHATMAALRKTFGGFGQQGTTGMFGQPPRMITLNTDTDETVQVPWGIITIASLPGVTFELGGERHPELGTLFTMSAFGPRKFRHHVEGVFNLIQSELETNSIYRGKAFNGAEMPEFLDLSNIDESKVIYSDEVMTQLDANLWSLIEHSDAMREHGVPLKRSVLFEGPFGTGKTLGAYLTAKKCRENGWSFIYCRPTTDNLREVMATARLYQPAVVFFEDVDTASSSADDTRVTALLDMFDGIQAKGTEIIAVLTTNHVERIHKGMVRPGRLDSVIHIGSLDDRGVRRLVESVVPANMLATDLDWGSIHAAFRGYLPAFAREAIDRAVRYNIARNDGESTPLATADFVAAAEGLRPQLALMESAKEGEKPDTLTAALSNVVRDAVDGIEMRDYDDDFTGRLADPE